jgi:hypothetical protein
VDTKNPSNVICVWHDDRDNFPNGANNSYNDAFATISNDAGVTWSPNIRLSSTSGPGTQQRNEVWGVSWRGDHITVSAERSEGNTSTLMWEDSLLFQSQDGGSTWSEIFLTEIGSTFYPARTGNDVNNPYLDTTPSRNDAIVTVFHDAPPATASDLHALSVRVPYIKTSTPVVPGASGVQIQVEQIGESNAGGFAVLFYNQLASGSLPGLLPFGNGVDIDLIFDGTTATMFTVTPLSALAVPSGGAASTPPFNIPMSYPTSPVLQVQAAILSPTLTVTETTDFISF